MAAPPVRGADSVICEQPHTEPTPDLPALENPTLDNPTQEKPMQLNRDKEAATPPERKRKILSF